MPSTDVLPSRFSYNRETPQMTELGNKHECLGCSTKFYDLGKNELVCPNCGENQKDLAEALEASGGKATSSRKKATKKKAAKKKATKKKATKKKATKKKAATDDGDAKEEKPAEESKDDGK